MSSMPLIRTAERRGNWAVADWIQVAKIRIVVMVGATVLVTGLVAAGGWTWSALHAAVGVLFLGVSGSAWNQYLERYTDFLMRRTAQRPIPGFRLTASQVAGFGMWTLGCGIAYLAALVPWPAAAVAVATWILYVLVYTPLKPVTWWNTAVGAIAGALPILVGSLAAVGSVTPLAWLFFAVLVLWQYPHFMAIAWMYRDDYRAGGLQMATTVDPSGRLAGKLAVGFSVALTAISPLGIAGAGSAAGAIAYSVLSTAIALVYVAAAIRFQRQRDDAAARRLLRVSLFYLPLFMAALLAGARL